eukprot:GILJ01008230.1.p1 GENE.GILJ01008230.1~~GILJ01008230.1.p1  ORF type:complete len:1309 (+),score=160.60 GILJ01008230.1:159-3929(+)
MEVVTDLGPPTLGDTLALQGHFPVEDSQLPVPDSADGSLFAVEEDVQSYLPFHSSDSTAPLSAGAAITEQDIPDDSHASPSVEYSLMSFRHSRPIPRGIRRASSVSPSPTRSAICSAASSPVRREESSSFDMVEDLFGNFDDIGIVPADSLTEEVCATTQQSASASASASLKVHSLRTRVSAKSMLSFGSPASTGTGTSSPADRDSHGPLSTQTRSSSPECASKRRTSQTTSVTGQRSPKSRKNSLIRELINLEGCTQTIAWYPQDAKRPMNGSSKSVSAERSRTSSSSSMRSPTGSRSDFDSFDEEESSESSSESDSSYSSDEAVRRVESPAGSRLAVRLRPSRQNKDSPHPSAKRPKQHGPINRGSVKFYVKPIQDIASTLMKGSPSIVPPLLQLQQTQQTPRLLISGELIVDPAGCRTEFYDFESDAMFLSRLTSLLESAGIYFDTKQENPSVDALSAGVSVHFCIPHDLPALYRKVIQMGGYATVTMDEKWSALNQALNRDPATVIDLQSVYSKYLFVYEKTYSRFYRINRQILPDISVFHLKPELLTNIPRMYFNPAEYESCRSLEFGRKALDLPIVNITNFIKSGLGLDNDVFSMNRIKAEHGEQVVDVVMQDPHAFGFQLAGPKRQSVPLHKYVRYQEQCLRGSVPNHVQFAVNVDIGHWENQMRELRNKIPDWFLCDSPLDVLSFMRQKVNGMNLPQLYVKVPGVWTGGHEENCRFRSVNVNHGPYESEWGAVEQKYVPLLRQKVIDQCGIDIYKNEGKWFPDPDFCLANGIPVMYGLQKVNDVILVGIGCVHWVRARGVTINSSWNFGTMDLQQLQSSFERYDKNREIGFQSLVPMYTLSFDLLTRKRDVLPLDLYEFLLTRLSNMVNDEIKTTQNYPLIQPEPAGSMVVYCERSGCKSEIFNHYFWCTACSDKMDSCPDKSKNLPTIFCSTCAVEHQLRRKHEFTVFRKMDMAQLESYMNQFRATYLRRTGQIGDSEYESMTRSSLEVHDTFDEDMDDCTSELDPADVANVEDWVPEQAPLSQPQGPFQQPQRGKKRVTSDSPWFQLDDASVESESNSTQPWMPKRHKSTSKDTGMAPDRLTPTVSVTETMSDVPVSTSFSSVEDQYETSSLYDMHFDPEERIQLEKVNLLQCELNQLRKTVQEMNENSLSRRPDQEAELQSRFGSLLGDLGRCCIDYKILIVTKIGRTVKNLFIYFTAEDNRARANSLLNGWSQQLLVDVFGVDSENDSEMNTNETAEAAPPLTG